MKKRSFKERIHNLRYFKQGVKNLSLKQQLGVQKTATFWGAIGLSMAWLSLVYSLFIQFDWTRLGFAIFLYFIIVTQSMQHMNAVKQLKDMENLDDGTDIDEIEAVLPKETIDRLKGEQSV